MNHRLLALSLTCAAVLAACSTPVPDTPRKPASPDASSAPSATVPETKPLAKAPTAAAATSEAYRKEFAERIVQVSNQVFDDPLPKMLKSIVVVDITLESDGKLKNVAIRRSNGFKALENTALDSVRKAAPYSAPPRSMRRNDGTVTFLETFLFRDDGRFQVRTLAGVQ